MRQILFRGKRKDNQEWVEGFYLEITYCDGKGRQSFIKMDGCPPIPIDLSTVGQYTGVNDKNGNKIFEGDIVKLKSVKAFSEQGKGFRGEVKFIDSGFYVYDGEQAFALVNESNEIEISMNVHL